MSVSIILKNPLWVFLISILSGMTAHPAASSPSLLSPRSNLDLTSFNWCPQTSHVATYSGYIPVGEGVKMFFWYFEALHDSDSKPLVAWLSGGPGASSTRTALNIGPCHLRDTGNTLTDNKYSWTQAANMIYIDQVGTGYTVTDDKVLKSIDSSEKLAPLMWEFMQKLYRDKRFRKFQHRGFGIATTSHGGHYGPIFLDHFLKQNKAGEGDKIDVQWLLAEGPWVDMEMQTKAQIEYAVEKNMITKEAGDKITKDDFEQQCVPALEKCLKTGKDEDCKGAEWTCADDEFGIAPKIENSFTEEFQERKRKGKWSLFDIDMPDKTSPNLKDFMLRPETRKDLGADTDYVYYSNPILDQFHHHGDSARSSLPHLRNIVEAGVKVLLLVGMNDFLCNYKGVEKVADNVKPELAKKELSRWNVKNKEKGLYKAKDNLALLVVNDAGHGSYDRAQEVGLDAFRQLLEKGTITST